MTLIKLLLILPVLAFSAPADYVNPLVGTGGRIYASAMLSPAATAPFGMVKLGPDTRFPKSAPNFLHSNALGTSGYHKMHSRIRGFSMTRLQGTGAMVGGIFRVMPFSRKKRLRKIHHGVNFKHKNESAKAGYYSAYLHQEKIKAEMTATPHCGFQRYTFTKDRNYILLDGTSTLTVQSPAEDVQIHQLDHQTFQGQATQTSNFAGRYGGLTAYFHAKVTPKPSHVQFLKEGQRLLLSFDKSPTALLKICMSYVSNENAKLNYNAQALDQSFDQAYQSTKKQWNERFSTVSIKASDKVKKQFFTALYHTMQMPTLYTDTNGEYLGFNQTIGKANGFTYYSDLSLWDTFRTAHPVYTLFAQDIQMNSVKSLMEMAAIGGQFPRWAQGGGYAGSMFGSPANFLIGETYFKNLGEFDIEKALGYMVSSVVNPNPDLPGRELTCIKRGYCSSDIKASVSKTLEYAWADSITSLIAKDLGKDGIAKEFKEYSQFYKNLWDPEDKFFKPKDQKGNWGKIAPFLVPYIAPKKYARPYSEGSPRHYRYSVPHEPKELIKLFGGEKTFVKKLNRFIKKASPGMASLNPTPNYWHGNQHNLHAIYLFNEAGAAHLTQKWARWALTDRYALHRRGYDGNDDGGTLSGWYVLSSLGLYPQAGTNKYWLGSPIVNQATMKIGDKTLNLEVHNQSPKNIYVKEVRLNGVKVCQPEITHQELEGTLRFIMSDSPQRTYNCGRG